MQDSYSANIMQLLTVLSKDIVRIDRRPALDSVPFHDIYFVEIERGVYPSGTELSHTSWSSDLADSIDGVRTVGGDAIVLGIW